MRKKASLLKYPVPFKLQLFLHCRFHTSREDPSTSNLVNVLVIFFLEKVGVVTLQQHYFPVQGEMILRLGI